MARTSTYLNFMGKTEEAFAFYREVFGTDYAGPIARMSDIPPGEGMPELSAAEKRMVAHIELPITGGHVLMGSDVLASMGHELKFGTNVHINLEPDTREETRRLFDALAEGGNVTMPLRDMFWGAYFGSVRDRYDVQWMVNCTAK